MRIRPLALAGLMAATGAACAGLTACAAVTVTGGIPRGRVLPSYVKRLSIPEFRNRTRTFAMTPDLTLKTQEAFLSDGRLDVDANGKADLRLEGTVTEYREIPGGLQDDRYPIVTNLQMLCQVELWDPYDSDRLAPVFRYEVPAIYTFVSDTRRTVAESRVEAVARLQEAMAANIVNAVINSPPAALKPLQQRAAQRYAERRAPGQYSPEPALQPRFPDPARTKIR